MKTQFNHPIFRKGFKALLWVGIAGLGGCAFRKPSNTSCGGKRELVSQDPWERCNRQVFRCNNFVDQQYIKPLNKGYQRVVPGGLRQGIANFTYHWMTEPVSFLSCLLQWKFKKALAHLSRFSVNTVFGLGGVVDVLKLAGSPVPPMETFNDFLAKTSVPKGPYVIVPLLGPFTLRDLGGFLVTSCMNPFFWLWYKQYPGAVYGTTFGYFGIALMDSLQDKSLLFKFQDPYDFLRCYKLGLTAGASGEENDDDDDDNDEDDDDNDEDDDDNDEDGDDDDEDGDDDEEGDKS